MTPESVHYGREEGIFIARSVVLADAYEKHPNRFKGKMPRPPVLPQAVWISKTIFN